ncbi:hypothetical protein GCM10010518_21290 [Kitasatospora cinereorecta]
MRYAGTTGTYGPEFCGGTDDAAPTDSCGAVPSRPGTPEAARLRAPGTAPGADFTASSDDADVSGRLFGPDG